jgi:hypothetical protein
MDKSNINMWMMVRPTVTTKLIPIDKERPWGGLIFMTVGHGLKITCCEQRDD